MDDYIPYPRHRGVSGIYEIYCIANQKSYIGSAQNLMHRRNDHLAMLRNNQHNNIHLQRAFNLYGEASFEFRVIELCESENLLEREQFYIDTLHPEFNISPFAGAPMKGRHHALEYVQRMSNERKGIPKSEEHKRKIGEAHKGQILSEEHRRKISETLKNSPYRGEQSNNAKLTEADVIEIRRLHANGISRIELGKIFNVHHSTIGRIVRRDNWKHI